MLGVYIAYTAVEPLGGTIGFWPAVLLAALGVGLIGALVEVLLLRRIYHAHRAVPAAGHLCAGAGDQGRRAVAVGCRRPAGPARTRPGRVGRHPGPAFPTYDLLLIVVGPLVLGLLWLLLTRTRWGTLVRAATQDREMVGALGVNQAWLFTSVFALGAGAGRPGRRAASCRASRVAEPGPADHRRRLRRGGGGRHGLDPRRLHGRAADRRDQGDLRTGLGTVQAFGIDFSFSKLTLVVEFLVMAVVLVARPWGLLGRAQGVSRNSAPVEAPLRAADAAR